MNKIRKYWKEIVIIILVIFSLNKCTTSCNRAQENAVLTEANKNYEKMIDSLSRISDMQSVMIDESARSQTVYQGIATSNQKALVDQVDALGKRNDSLVIVIDKLKKENMDLKRQIKAGNE